RDAAGCSRASLVLRIAVATDRSGRECPVLAVLLIVRVRCRSATSADMIDCTRSSFFMSVLPNIRPNTYQDAPSFLSLRLTRARAIPIGVAGLKPRAIQDWKAHA